MGIRQSFPAPNTALFSVFGGSLALELDPSTKLLSSCVEQGLPLCVPVDTVCIAPAGKLPNLAAMIGFRGMGLRTRKADDGTSVQEGVAGTLLRCSLSPASVLLQESCGPVVESPRSSVGIST